MFLRGLPKLAVAMPQPKAKRGDIKVFRWAGVWVGARGAIWHLVSDSCKPSGVGDKRWLNKCETWQCVKSPDNSDHGEASDTEDNKHDEDAYEDEPEEEAPKAKKSKKENKEKKGDEEKKATVKAENYGGE